MMRNQMPRLNLSRNKSKINKSDEAKDVDLLGLVACLLVGSLLFPFLVADGKVTFDSYSVKLQAYRRVDF